MGELMIKEDSYKSWLLKLKLQIRSSQVKAAVKVNTELLKLYWNLGAEICKKQEESAWGDRFFTQLSKDLMAEFPDTKGFSSRNLRYCMKFYIFYNQNDIILQQLAAKLDSPKKEILPQAVAELENTQKEILHQVGAELENDIFLVPWGHHRYIIDKCKTVDEALFYVRQTVENGWSRNVLLNMISTNYFETKGRAITNFRKHLPDVQSDLAQQTLKDPYNFDFLALRGKYNERELEDALTENITRFLLELGSGFSYVGRQQKVEVGDKEFFIDLLFYHLKLRCYIVVELKTGEFEPEYVGKLGFYVSAVNHQMKLPEDQPTIGLLICKSKNELIAQYTLESTSQPIGISEYELNELYPKEIKNAIPSIQEIEKELGSIQ